MESAIAFKNKKPLKVSEVINIMNTSIVQAAWANGQELSVHTWVYSLKTGIIKDLEVTSSCLDDVTPAFKIG